MSMDIHARRAHRSSHHRPPTPHLGGRMWKTSRMPAGAAVNGYLLLSR
jgi:hypothetical protein